MTKDIQKTALRLPRDLHSDVIIQAEKSGRTMNAEIVYRLRNSLLTDSVQNSQAVYGHPDCHQDLMVTAFQALYRQRIMAYESACTACRLAGNPLPERHIFGIDVVSEALRSMGSTPSL